MISKLLGHPSFPATARYLATSGEAIKVLARTKLSAPNLVGKSSAACGPPQPWRPQPPTRLLFRSRT